MLNITFHYPTKKDDIDDFKRRKGEAHVQVIQQYLLKINLSKAKSDTIIENVIKNSKF